MLIQDIIENELRGIIEAPDFLLQKLFIQTIQRFLNETWLLLSEYEYIFSDKSILEYDFPTFQDKNIISVKAYQLINQNKNNKIVFFNSLINNDIVIDIAKQKITFLENFVKNNDGCKVWFVVNYNNNITEIDDIIYIHFKDGLIGGTIVLASLRYGIKPAQGLQLFSTDYNEAVSKAKMLINNNYFTQSIMVKQRKFV